MKNQYLKQTTGNLTGSLLLMAALSQPSSAEALPGELLLSDEAVPWQEIGKDFPKRPAPVTETIEDLVFESNRERKAIIAKQNETGEDLDPPKRKTIFGSNPFLNSGSIFPGFETPTGAVWQPTVVIYGTYRTALQHFDNGLTNSTEWANRLDLFTNIYLTPTERILFSIRPLDNGGNFTSYRFDDPSGYNDSLNGRIRSLYFEGDFGELFPNLDPHDTKNLDYGFAVGRMPLNFQDGIMINDSVDAFGVTRASMFNFGASASRLTALVAWNEIHRGNNIEDPDASLFGLFYAADYSKSTYEVDLAYVNGSNSTGGDGLYFGIGQTRRFGKYNSTLRANLSYAMDDETAAIDTGALLFSQISRTMDYNFDIAYINSFVGIGNYTSAARDPSVGGPIGGINGLLFGAVGLGRYGSAISNRSNDAVGASIGYQHFLDGQYSKRQIVAEIGGRISTDGNSRSGGGIGLSYQHALDQHSIIRLDSFLAAYDDGETGTGLRCEYSFQF
ncbi:hypothetical protein ACFSSA_05335 [Luteolibacter algae]|uniref:Uncharacterized protein n=1 Tax=Luteolibacter algae TaxID=454151 RepID=A0ABW5D4W5_9BACT